MNINKTDLELIHEFMEEYYQDFQEFLEFKEIEPTEADRIIDMLKEAISKLKE